MVVCFSARIKVMLACVLGSIITLIALLGTKRTQMTSSSPTRHLQHYPKYQPATCHRQDNLYLLKMHKTGSTTMFNIINRVALRRHLRMATYTMPPFHSESPDRIVRFLVPKFTVGESQKYNMLGQHSYYDKEYISKVLESPHVNVTFLRHPQTHLRSYLVAMGLQRLLRLKGPDVMKDFLENIHRYRKIPIAHISRNPMADELLISRDAEETTAEKAIMDIDQDFILGLNEFYDESLILIRRKLCWTLQDIIYVPLRLTPYFAPIDKTNKTLRRLACLWSNLDCQMYEHVSTSFWRKIHAEGPQFYKEVAYFKQVLKKTFSYCGAVYNRLRGHEEFITDLEEEIAPLAIPRSQWNAEFKVSVLDCALMRVPGVSFPTLLYYIQNKEECESLRREPRQPCRIMWKSHIDLCKVICSTTNDTRDMVINFLKDERVYMWI